jgi:hypothetical protein
MNQGVQLEDGAIPDVRDHFAMDCGVTDHLLVNEVAELELNEGKS